MTDILSLLQASIVFGTVILYGALGEIITEKSGNLNLGVPGIMYLGGIAGLASAFGYELSTPTPNPAVCLALSFVCAFLAAAAGGLLYSFLTITLRANQNVTGLTLTIFGGGVANFYGGALNTMAGGVGQISVATTSAAYRANIPALANLGAPGRLLFSYGFMVYLAILLAVLLRWFLNRTRMGLNLRSVGENPATADAAGVNVIRYKYLATCIGAGISGLAVLHHGLHQGHLGQRGHHRGPGLAGRGPGYLCRVAVPQRHLGRLPVRLPHLAVPVYPGPEPLQPGAVQDAALSGHHPGAGGGEPAEEAGESAAGTSGAVLLP